MKFAVVLEMFRGKHLILQHHHKIFLLLLIVLGIALIVFDGRICVGEKCAEGLAQEELQKQIFEEAPVATFYLGPDAGEIVYSGKLNDFNYQIGPVVNLQKTGLATPSSGFDAITLDYTFEILKREMNKPIEVNGVRYDNYFMVSAGENPLSSLETQLKEQYFGMNYDVSYTAEGPIIQTVTTPVSELLAEHVTPIVKPVAWNVFGPLFVQAELARQKCETVGGPENTCQVPKVVLGMIYFGLFDPPERVAFKYYQGDRKLPQFCPNQNAEGLQCITDVQYTQNPSAKGKISLNVGRNDPTGTFSLSVIGTASDGRRKGDALSMTVQPRCFPENPIVTIAEPDTNKCPSLGPLAGTENTKIYEVTVMNNNSISCGAQTFDLSFMLPPAATCNEVPGVGTPGSHWEGRFTSNASSTITNIPLFSGASQTVRFELKIVSDPIVIDNPEPIPDTIVHCTTESNKQYEFYNNATSGGYKGGDNSICTMP